MVRNREDAEDLVQEVYIRVLNSYDKFQGKSSEKTWLFSIAKNVAIDHFRKQKNWKQRIYEKFDWDKWQIKDERALPEELVIKDEDTELLLTCLGACNKNYQMVLILRFLNELSIKETAEALSWSESKVKTTQHRALKILKEKMEALKTKEGKKHASI